MKSADWVYNHLARQGKVNKLFKFNEFQEKAIELICRACRCGAYDIEKVWDSATIQTRYCDFHISRTLATFDSDGLTRLVIGAHEEKIRAEINPRSRFTFTVSLFERNTERNSAVQAHPTIEQAVELYRLKFGGAA